MKISGLKLFSIEYGTPEKSWDNKTVYVVEKSYDSAVEKALKYIEDEEKNENEKSVLTSDGSLKNKYSDNNNKENRIKEIKILTDHIIY